MSLDVYLNLKGAAVRNRGSGIFVRENGETKELSRAEWDAKFPGREPVMAPPDDDPGDEVYHRNITHNLGTMAAHAGVYVALWRPEEMGATKAEQLIKPLAEGLEKLQADPEEFRKHNPKNGWGDYDGLVAFVADYLSACRDYPSAEIHVSR